MLSNIITNWSRENKVVEQIIGAFSIKDIVDEKDSEKICLRGICFHKGLFDFSQNYENAIQEYEKSIEHGCVEAKNNLAYMYRYGTGVPQDFLKAKELFEDAIKLGCLHSMANLASMYSQGYGASRDVSKAITIYEDAIELGYQNIYSAYNLAYLYMNIFPPNRKRAIELYYQSWKLGFEKAKQKLEQMNVSAFELMS